MKVVPKIETIRKCKGTDCTFKTDCYRYMAEDIGHRQRWLEKVPFYFQSCSAFAPLRIKGYFDLRNKHLQKGGE